MTIALQAVRSRARLGGAGSCRWTRLVACYLIGPRSAGEPETEQRCPAGVEVPAVQHRNLDMTYHSMGPDEEQRLLREASRSRWPGLIALALGGLFAVVVVFMFMASDRSSIVSKDGPAITSGQGGANSKMPDGRTAP